MKDTYGIDGKAANPRFPQRVCMQCSTGWTRFPNGYGAAFREMANICEIHVPNGDGAQSPSGIGTQSPNGANVCVNHVAPLGQTCIGALHTQGVALGYHRLCRWHIGRESQNRRPPGLAFATELNTWGHTIFV